jgi:hypothetical protein
MESKSMTRKEFIALTFTLIGGAAAASCSDDNGGSSGTGGTTNVSTGLGGSSGGSTGSRGGTTGSAGANAAGHGGTTGGAACGDPLPESQVPDSNDHVHMVMVPAATLDATSAQTFSTTVAKGHTHDITLSPADLATIKGGGMVTVPSTITESHMHSYTVRCT